MSEAERTAEERRACRMAELDDGFSGADGRGLYLSRRFPMPNTEGMSSAEAEVTLAKWRAEVNAFIAAAEGRATTAVAPLAAQPANAPEAPVA